MVLIAPVPGHCLPFLLHLTKIASNYGGINRKQSTQLSNVDMQIV